MSEWEELKEFTKDFWRCVRIPVAILFAAVVCLVAISTDKYRCHVYGEETGRKTKYVLDTCYANINGQWYTGRELRAILIAEGQKTLREEQ